MMTGFVTILLMNFMSIECLSVLRYTATVKLEQCWPGLISEKKKKSSLISL